MFNYCPNCAFKIQSINNHIIACSNCGFNFYINPAPTNGVIFTNKKGGVLLVKRKFPPKKSYWDIPGGFVDFNETSEESVKREVKEELGFIVSKIKFFSSYASPYLYKGFLYHTICFVYLGKIDNQKIIPGDDVSEIRFFSKDKIPFNKLAFPNVKNSISDYLSSLK